MIYRNQRISIPLFKNLPFLLILCFTKRIFPSYSLEGAAIELFEYVDVIRLAVDFTILNILAYNTQGRIEIIIRHNPK